MISAYGERAAYFAGLLGSLDAIVVEFDLIADAYLEAVRYREQGRRFYGLVLWDDARVRFSTTVGHELLAQATDYDHRRVLADQLTRGMLNINGRVCSDYWRADPDKENVASEFLALADVMLVRSWYEYGKMRDWFGRGTLRPAQRVERILGTATVPIVDRVRPRSPGVVVWAPTRDVRELALVIHGLEEVRADITIVTGSGPIPAYGSYATFAQRNDPRVLDALSRASVVVCPEPSDAADAVAFARLGYGVAATITSGAQEFCSDIVTWDLVHTVGLPSAIAAAMTQPAVVRWESPPLDRVPPMPPMPLVDELPLVSVITPTFNRRDDLRRMLECLAAQTYPNVECVVVNDAGCAIDDIVAEFPFARLIEQPQNAGALVAIGVGRANMRGEYLAILPDDDWFYPDHIERVMSAILRTGCSVGHAAGLLRFVERAPDGTFELTGFNATTFSQSITPTDALITSPIGNNQVIFKASVFDEVGWFRTDTDVSDNEVHSRVAACYLYAFVNHTTNEFRAHSNSAGSSVDFPASVQHFYDVIAPTPDRPYLNVRRQACLETIRARPAGQPPFPRSIAFAKKE